MTSLAWLLALSLALFAGAAPDGGKAPPPPPPAPPAKAPVPSPLPPRESLPERWKNLREEIRAKERTAAPAELAALMKEMGDLALRFGRLDEVDGAMTQ